MDENKLLLATIEDKLERFHNYYCIVNTDFLNLSQQAAARGLIQANKDVKAFFYGGFTDAERRQLIFVPDYVDAEDETGLIEYFHENPDLCPLVVLELSYQGGAKGKNLGHRDFLGSLLAEGIKREKLGDILVSEGGAQMCIRDRGSTTAIVGPSGSGKTTICNLIARFYDIDSGKVLVGGENVRDMTCDSLLRNISMVFQKVYLFHDTIENNIRFGNPNASQEEVIAAAKKARCHDFIMALPDGYQTVIGEGGSTLSGGEKQRISIARAILKNADIVILDEATASIDPENEHLIQQAISELTVGKTVIVIAHRLATIEHADQILVVDNGQIVQKGTHGQLIRQEGIYRKFINIREQAEGWSIA